MSVKSSVMGDCHLEFIKDYTLLSVLSLSLDIEINIETL